MKARFFALAALVLGMVSCQQDFDAAPQVGGEVDFQLSVGAGEISTTRATDGDTQEGYDSAYGAIDYLSEADWTKYDLRYSLEVYDKADDYANATPIKDRMVQIVDKYQPVMFDLRLVPNRDYHFVVFADFVPQGASSKANTEVQSELGLRHNIGDNLGQITIKNDAINDEIADAYFATKDIKIQNSAAQDILLKRPYGKVRVIATDLAELNLNVDPAYVKVFYTAKHPQKFNAVTGAIDTYDQNVEYEFQSNYAKGVSKNSLANHYYTADYDAKKDKNANGIERHTHMTLFTDYILATDEQESIHFTMQVYDKGGLIKETHFNTDIPVQRNNLTTIVGNVLTTATEINVTIDDNFANYNYVGYEVENAAELATALTADMTNISVVLANDIDLPISMLGQQTGGSGEYKLGGEQTKSITIDLNGKKLNITTNYWSGIGAKNADALFTIKNGTMTSSQPTGTWNSYDVTFANCNYVIENVEFEKSIAFTNAGKNVALNNVEINETHDYYAMWISAEGQEVKIDGLTINATAGRGIKIDEQYVDAPAKKVILNVKNATFNTAKKAAILVKSVEGADITVSNIDIANVKADGTHVVWVDEDAKAYADKVTVEGGLMIVEGAASASAFNVEGATIELASGNYNFPAKVANGVTIKGAGVVMNMADSFIMGNVKNLTLDGITVNWKGANYTGFTHSSGHLYKNVTFNGAFFCYGQYAKFEDCTFNLNCNQYVWTYASDVDFEDCSFNCVDGKGVLIYNEGVAVDVNFTDCEFSSSKEAYTGTGEPIAAIEISNSVKNPVFNVNIVNCTSKGGFAYDEYICRVKNDAKSMKNLNITVDGAIVVSSAEGLESAAAAAANGDTIKVIADIEGNVTVAQKPDVKITIDGNNRNYKGVIVVDGKSATYTTAGLTIKDLNFNAETISADACIRLGDGTNDTRYTCNVLVDGCTFDVPGAVGVKSYTGGDKNLTISNCTATAKAHSMLQAKGIDGILVKKVNVLSKNGLNFNNSNNVVVDSSNVDVQGYAVRFGEGSSDTTGAAESYLIENSTLKSACADEGDAVIVLRGTAAKATLNLINTTINGKPQFINNTDAKVYVDGAIVVSNADEIAAALTADKANVGVVLANDIDLPISKLGQQTGGSGEYKLGGEQTENISIDLNGYKLNITTTYWSGIGAKNDKALFTIKNGTMTSSQSTGTWNSYDLTFANCNYVIEDVVFDKAIAFTNAGKEVALNDVVINETHDYYAMWISAEGQNVAIDGLTINSAGRGIKIDEQYVDAPAKVTLNVANATFTTAKKAAIMVKSAAGAEINVDNLDITGVAADKVNAVWVDADAAAYFDLVTVNGASKEQEK